MKLINVIALILIVVGALNWGLWGFFEFDLVSYLFGGNMTSAARIVYGLVGLAGLWSLSFFGKMCHCTCCMKGKGCGR